MKPFVLALLGSVALAALPEAAHAQSMNAALDCGPDTPTPSGTGTPTPSASGTPTPSPTGTGTGGTGTGGTGTGGTGTGGTGGGDTGTGTPTPSPTTVVGGGGGETTTKPYVTNGSVSGMRVTSSMHGSTNVKYYRASASQVNAANKQDLAAVKTYPRPNGNGVVKTVGGQLILAKDNNVKLNGLSRGILNIIDEINLTAAALGLPDPVITAGHDQAGHSPTSDHYTGNALDLRCNNVSTTACKQWVIALQNALGSPYDVLFEDWGGSNSHVHISYG